MNISYNHRSRCDQLVDHLVKLTPYFILNFILYGKYIDNNTTLQFFLSKRIPILNITSGYFFLSRKKSGSGIVQFTLTEEYL
jgi:hypothetical protein